MTHLDGWKHGHNNLLKALADNLSDAGFIWPVEQVLDNSESLLLPGQKHNSTCCRKIAKSGAHRGRN